MTQSLSTDVVIIGAGIAGVWLHNRLNAMGFHALLLEQNSIGSAQTISAQGIIHGGTKYALNGILSNATQAIGAMPKHWQQCLAGQGDVDLTQAKVLTDHQLMWSQQQLSSKMLSFFASKALSSRMQTIGRQARPAIFQHQDFQGNLYRLDEPVIDVPSVLKALNSPWRERTIKINADTIEWHRQGEKINAISLNDTTQISAQHFICTAGAGNAQLLADIGLTQPKMQLRPLHMLLCKARDASQTLPTLFAHSLGSGSKPIATISSHLDANSNVVWYIGGNIAENGVETNPQQLEQQGQQLLGEILPWVALPELDWATHRIDRAEPKQSSLTRPDTAFVESHHNLHIAWPTKLALTPDLADRIIERLTAENIIAGNHRDSHQFAAPDFCATLWDSAFS